MSSYVIDRNHIQYIIESALVRADSYRLFRWYHERWHELDNANASEVGQMLWNQNIAGVEGRYPDTKETSEFPGPINESYIYYHTPKVTYESTPEQLFMSLDCYEYQSCDITEWEESSAKKFVETLRSLAWHDLPGYVNAEWGAPEPSRARRLLG